MSESFYLNRCAPAQQSAHQPEYYGCVCHPGLRCSQLRAQNTEVGEFMG